MGETTNLNWFAGFLPSTVYSILASVWTNHHKVTQLFASALVKAASLRTYLLRWWQKHCASCIQVLWNGKMIVFKLFLELWWFICYIFFVCCWVGCFESFSWGLHTLYILRSFGHWDWIGWDWNHVESRVKEVIQWSKIWSKHVCIKKMSSFPVFLATKKILGFSNDLVDQKDQQKPTKPRWSCRWCGYWVFGICTQVRHYRWAWNFGEEEVKADWNCLKVSWDTGKDMWWHDKSMFDLKKNQVSFECSMLWETLGLLLT